VDVQIVSRLDAGEVLGLLDDPAAQWNREAHLVKRILQDSFERRFTNDERRR
jgi:hypothetical protein